ncbi:MAG TPA: M23 family metallopeptidase [Clostridia bacterium]|jgi:murein DD-endopeptidase MepM/ murein hydrolase activator NlpD
MEKKERKGGVAVKSFFKKNLYYILLIVSLLAIGTVITVALVLSGKEKPGLPAGGGETKMIVPVQGEYTVARDYHVNKLIWFATIKTNKTHLGVDFAAQEGTPVVAVLDGVVEEVDTNNILKGNVVKIKHSDSLTTVYMSLKNVTVKKGDTIKAGDKIGEVSASMGIEKDMGPHLHFEVIANGKTANPNDYLTLTSDK